MMRDHVNIQAVQLVAQGLGDLRERVAFVGGAVISLYADDPGAEMPRPTSDIDLVVEVTGYGAYANLEERLVMQGFHHSPEDHIVCRYRYQGVTVDIMPTNVPSVGPTNPWYLPGMAHAQIHPLRDGMEIRILTAPYFLGTKLEAHHSRGGDPRTSKDFEDIVFLLDSRMRLIDEVLAAPEDIRRYLHDEAGKLMNAELREAIEGHLNPAIASERAQILIDRLQSIATKA